MSSTKNENLLNIIIDVVRKSTITFIILIFIMGIIFGILSTVDNARRSRIERIEYVLNQDHELFYQNASQHSREMSNIDLSGCPEDFKEAYREHQKAWTAKSIADEGFFNFQEDRDARHAISQTWQDVLNIAEKHGVDVSKYR